MVDDFGSFLGEVYPGRMAQPAAGVREQSGLAQLEQKVEQQNLIIQTLLVLLLEKKIMTEDEFRQWMVYVDELDGKRDGRVKADTTPLTCKRCQRVNPRQATKCIYCGTPFEVEFLARRIPTDEAKP